ncbi:MAG: V-type ATPase subunit [Clostridiales bacterium]|nr:V-type ATPase subunit [Clostridiales bacterium]
MRETDYAFAVAYVRTLENKMLSPSDIDSLKNAQDAEEALRILEQTGYGDGKKDAEEMICAELEKSWSEVRGACPKGAPVDILLYKNDFQNLKSIIKAMFGGVDYETLMLRPCTIEPRQMADAVRNGNFSALPELVSDIAAHAFDLLAKTGDGQLMEVYLDRELVEVMYREVKKHKSPFLEGLAKLESDMLNCSVMLRGSAAGIDERLAKEALSDIGSISKPRAVQAILQGHEEAKAYLDELYPELVKAWESSPAEFEKQKAYMLSRYLAGARYRAFGIEPIVAFLYTKENEAGMVRIIISGLKNNIPKEIISERLRELYV